MKIHNEKVEKNNQEKFAVLREFNLPNDQYIITGSGPLGIRNMRTMGDLDIIVSPSLLATLLKKYEITDENGIKKIILSEGVLEAFWEDSFDSVQFDSQAPTIAARIESAEIIDGLPFDTLENVLYYKRKGEREKDLHDIFLIEQWMKKHRNT